MASLSLGAFVRSCRVAAGIRSARELARRAGLSHSQVALLERDAYRPRWESFERIISALELRGAERDDALRLWRASGVPPAARDRSDPRFPGEALWRHFPAAMLARRFPRSEPGSTLELVAALPPPVRALAALLAWHELNVGRPAAAALKQARMLALSVYGWESGTRFGAHVEKKPEPFFAPPAERAQRAAAALPLLWTAALLSRESDATRLSAMVSAWTAAGEPIRLRVQFRGGVEQSGDVELVRSGIVAAVCDALVRVTLWERLKLADDLGQLDSATHSAGWREAAAELASWASGAAEPSPDQVQGAVADLRFAARLFEAAGLGEHLLGVDRDAHARRVSVIEAGSNGARATPDADR